MNKIFRTNQIADIDRYTIESESISSLYLMERAAYVWTEYFLKCFEGDLNGQNLNEQDSKIAVVAGSGNNGGDGYAIAQFLKESGRDVEVFHLMTGSKLSPDCEVNYRHWQNIGGCVKMIESVDQFSVEEDVVLIDAIFGSGLNRKVSGLVAEVIQKMNTYPNKIVAVDIPSGLMGEDNSENNHDAIVKADYTFTFQFPKLAFMLAENADFVGEWSVLDIGLNREIIDKTATDWYYTTKETVQNLLPKPKKYAHKGTNGRGLLIAGKYGMMGAAILAAKGALHSGIGLLYCHVPKKATDIIQMSVPEAVLDVDMSEKCFSEIKDLSKYKVVAVGPGIGQDAETLAALSELLRIWKGVTILDADALNLIADNPELLEFIHNQCILTPHPKEFERLVGKSANDFERLKKLSKFAKRYQTFIILKGAHSAIATPDGCLHFNMSGNPGMAKAGSGDVLVGIMLALAANGLDILDVARVGAFAHGFSADILLEEYGVRGITSGMIAENMGRAWKRLETIG